MKKSIIALMGLFTLVACSDETLQESGELNKNPDTELSNGVYTYDPATGYDSPFDTSLAGGSVNYEFINNTTNLRMEVTMAISEAYFDGADDDVYNHTFLGGPVAWSEYELSHHNTIDLSPSSNINLNSGHCPTADSSIHLFNVGKVLYYEVKVFDATTNMQVAQGTLAYNTTVQSSDWTYLKTSIYGDDLYYHNTSKEIITDSSQFPNMEVFTYGGNAYTYRLDINSSGISFVLN